MNFDLFEQTHTPVTFIDYVLVNATDLQKWQFWAQVCTVASYKIHTLGFYVNCNFTVGT